MKKAGLLFLMVIFSFSPLVSQDRTDEEILSRLTAHLSSIGKDAQLQRYVSGGILCGLGLLTTGTGVVAYMNCWLDQIVSGVLVGAGLGLAIPGGIVLAFPTEFEKLPEEFQKLPENSKSDLTNKITKGEVYFESLANKAKNERLLNAGIYLVLGLADLGMYLFPDILGDTVFGDVLEPLTQTYIYQGLTYTGLAVVQFIIKSRAESEYASYLNWKRQ